MREIGCVINELRLEMARSNSNPLLQWQLLYRCTKLNTITLIFLILFLLILEQLIVYTVMCVYFQGCLPTLSAGWTDSYRMLTRRALMPICILQVILVS